MKDINDYELIRGVTVGQLLTWINEKSEESKGHIIKLIRHRFENRYLKHLKPPVNSGFLIMAVSCFVIETLQSFREGEPDTSRIGKRMFKNFFDNDKEYFPGFYGISGEFYKDIRCGILHQSETTNAWRILRNGKLLDKTEFSINADLFLQSLTKSVNKYLDELDSSDLDSELWNNAFIKLNDICNNCKRV